MGSFNVACAISGLPCTPGDQVYAMLLTRNNAGDSRDVYPNDVWVPRTPAMLGTYADYGRVDFSDEPAEMVLQRLACSMLDVESVEAAGSLGRGGHVRHGMGLLAYLEAIEEGTLVVSCAADRDMRKMAVDFVAKHAAPAPPEPLVGPIPTIGSVVAVLEAGGLKANDPATTCFFVSEFEKGEIMVNCESWGGLKIEEAATVLAKTYAAVLARGRGHEDGAVVRVFPKPKTDGWVGPEPKWIRDEPREVALAVIRKDVWNAMLAHSVTTWREDEGIALPRYVEAEQAFRKFSLDFDDGCGDHDDPSGPLSRTLKRTSADSLLWEKRSVIAGHLGMVSCSGGSGAPGITGWALHHEAWLDMLASKAADVVETADDCGRRFAECCMVYDHLSIRSMRVMPSQYAGQDSSWADHGYLHHALVVIAATELRKEEENR